MLTRHGLLAVAIAPLLMSQAPPRELAADNHWRFHLADPPGAEVPAFDDSNWRTVHLPHDWSIESAPDRNNPSGRGGGYFPGGTGWYRKSFTAPPAWKGKRVTVEFDGVYMDSTIYLNGHKLGNHPYGYTAFYLDLTAHLNVGARNVLAVRVNNSAQPNSRWYSGSGIYRHVRVFVKDPVHVAHWGVFVTTPRVSRERAELAARTRVVNQGTGGAALVIRTTILDPRGAVVAKTETPVNVAAGAEEEVAQTAGLTAPSIWSPRMPSLYRAVTEVVNGSKTVDREVTTFGVRSVAWSVQQGFLLNGEPIKFIGGSVHHDNGPLGAAAFDRAEERRVQLLKAAGFNAVRTAHNPPSRTFLDACDRIGLLVIDEPFDVWTTPKVRYDYARFFKERWQRDIESMVLRDRNHPSVVIWSIGNEIPEAWAQTGAGLARPIAQAVRLLDPTRPLAQAFPGATYTANTDAAISVVDLAGYNYNLAANSARDHERVPSRIMLSTESFAADAFSEWRLAHDTPYILGEFVWTAMDYLGESGMGGWSYEPVEDVPKLEAANRMLRAMVSRIGEKGDNPFAIGNEGAIEPSPDFMKVVAAGYPWHAAYSGDLDLTGLRKPHSYYREIMWNGGNRVFLTVRLPEPEGKRIFAGGWAVYPTLASWTWPGHDGKPLNVEVYAATERVRLYLNGKPVAERTAGRENQFKALFTLPYVPGTLKAVGINGGRPVAERVLRTAGPATLLRLSVDRATIAADGQDLAFIGVEAVDAQGRFQPTADNDVEFALSGPGTIAAVGNGDGQSSEPYQSSRRRLFNGRSLIVVRSAGKSGTIGITARAVGLDAARATVTAVAAAPRASLE